MATTLVMLLKHETYARTPDEEDSLEDGPSSHSVTEAYRLLWRIVHLPAVLSLIATLMTMKVLKLFRTHFSNSYKVYLS